MGGRAEQKPGRWPHIRDAVIARAEHTAKKKRSTNSFFCGFFETYAYVSGIIFDLF